MTEKVLGLAKDSEIHYLEKAAASSFPSVTCTRVFVIDESWLEMLLFAVVGTSVLGLRYDS